MHFFGFFEVHNLENGGSDVGEEPLYLGFFSHDFFGGLFAVIIRRYEPDGDGVFGMFGVRFAGFEISHFLDIAVIGGDEEGAARLENDGDEEREAFVSGLDRLDGRLFVSGMTHHIGTRVVQ